MKNTYICVTEGQNEQWFFSAKEAADAFNTDQRYICNIVNGRLKRGYMVYDDKVYHFKRLPCGEPQYEMMRKLEQEVAELKKSYHKKIIKGDKHQLSDN